MEQRNLAEAIGGPVGRRYNPVEAAYDGMTEANRKTFRNIIQNLDYSHWQVAAALREIGYDIDRKQVQAYRERLALGKASL